MDFYTKSACACLFIFWPLFAPVFCQTEISPLAAERSGLDSLGIIPQLYKQARHYQQRGKSDSALILTKRGLSLLQTEQVNPRRAEVEINFLLVGSEVSQSDSMSMSYLMRAKEIIQSVEVSSEHKGDINFSLGLLHYESNRYDSCNYYLEHAVEEYGSNKIRVAESRLLWARSLRRFGDPIKAQFMILEAIRVLEQEVGSLHTSVASAYNDLAIVQGSINDQAGSQNSLSRALYIREKLYGRESNDFGTVLNNAALHHLTTGNEVLAKSYAEETIKIFENLENPYQRFHVASYNTMARVLEKMGDYHEAESHHKRSIQLHKTYFPGNGRIRFYLIGLGKNAMFRKDYQAAINSFHEAMSASFSNISSSDVFQNPSKDDPANFMSLKSLCLLKATAWHAWYDDTGDTSHLKQAIDLYDLSDYFATKNRIEVKFQKSREIYSSQNLTLYENALLANLEMWQITADKQFLNKSFVLNEKSKSLTLLEDLLETSALYTSGLPATVLEEESLLQDSIGIAKGLLLSAQMGGKKPEISRAQSELHRINLNFENFKRGLESEYPKYHEAKYDLNFSSIGQVQKELNKTQSLVEYFIGEENIFVYTISQIAANAYIFPKPDTLQQMVMNFLESINQYSLQMADTNFSYEQQAVDLYQFLWAPVEKDLTGNVTVVPDGILNYLPFGALLSGVPAELGLYNRYPYLERECTISYNYSATLKNQMQKNVSPINMELLAMAPTFVGHNAENDPLTPLQFNTNEAQLIHQIWEGKALVDKEATKSNFMLSANQYGLFHFATHAILDEQNADRSFLAFSNHNDQSQLYLHELYSMVLPAYLIVLSACRTNDGPVRSGEGIASLSRGFSYAGAKSIITSLWDVEDQSAMQIMKDFYQHLKDRKPIDEALHHTKVDYIQNTTREFAHPYFWSTFIAIGNTDLYFDTYPLYAKIGLVLLVFALLLFIAFKKNERSRTKI